MILVFYVFNSIIVILAIILFLVLFSKIEIRAQNIYFNNIEKMRNNTKMKIKVLLKIGEIPWLFIRLDKSKIEKIYLLIKKNEIKNNIDVEEQQKKMNKKIISMLQNRNIRKQIASIDLNLTKLKLEIRIANKEYPVTAYITSFVAILISNILPYITKEQSNKAITKNIYYKVEPVYVNKNAYDILADVTLNIKIYQIIFTLIRINKETNGKNKIKKKEGKNYGRTSNRKFNEHSYE